RFALERSISSRSARRTASPGAELAARAEVAMAQSRIPEESIENSRLREHLPVELDFGWRSASALKSLLCCECGFSRSGRAFPLRVSFSPGSLAFRTAASPPRLTPDLKASHLPRRGSAAPPKNKRDIDKERLTLPVPYYHFSLRRVAVEEWEGARHRIFVSGLPCR